jgi:hypothetical protein
MKKVLVALIFASAGFLCIEGVQANLPPPDNCDNCTGGCLCQNGHCPKKLYNPQIFDCPTLGGCCTGPL